MNTTKTILGAAAMLLAAAVVMAPATASAQDPVATPKRKAPVAKRKAPAKKKKPATRKAAPDKERTEAAPAEAEPEEPIEEHGPIEADEPGEEVEAEAEAEAEEAPEQDEGDGGWGASEEDWEQAETHTKTHRKRRRKARRRPASRKAERTEDDAVSPDPDRHETTRAVPPPSYASHYYGPKTLEYHDGGAIPPGYVKGTKVRKGLVIGGAITFGAAWLLSCVAATAIIEEEENNRYDNYDYDYDSRTGNESYYRRRNNDNDDFPDGAALYIPIAGPWIAMHTLEAEGSGLAALALDGLAQAAGFSMFVAGLAAKKTILVRDTKVDVAAAPGPGSIMLKATY